MVVCGWGEINERVVGAAGVLGISLVMDHLRIRGRYIDGLPCKCRAVGSFFYMPWYSVRLFQA